MKQIKIYTFAVVIMSVLAGCNSSSKNDSQSNKAPENEVVIEQVTKPGIDLGLSVNWAELNVGADSPEKTGYVIPFGNTTGTVKTANVGSNICGTDNDIAAKILGDGWRMPTAEEFAELVNECEWAPETLNGVKGFRVKASNGNSIFLPRTGNNYSTEDIGKYDFEATPEGGNEGNYWCGAPEPSLGLNHLHFNPESVTIQLMWCENCFHNAVRPVFE